MVCIGIVGLPHCLHSAVAGVAEMLDLANAEAGEPIFSRRVATADGKSVACYGGSVLGADVPLAALRADVALLPPVLADLDGALATPGVVGWLAAHHAAGGRVATVCAGSFLLAETGVLDGRPATTHWNLADLFRARYPAVDLQVERLLVDGGDYVCAGGVSAWMDLALHLIARHAGGATARRCAKLMLMDPHRETQAPYGLGGFRRDHGDEPVRAAQAWLEEHHAAPIRVRDMARAAALGERTFQRRFLAATGKSPGRYLQQVRVVAAQTLLETTSAAVEEVAEAVGYGDYSAFRKSFARIMGCTPSAYRQRFGTLRPESIYPL